METPSECHFEGFEIQISINALETQDEVFQWITEDECPAF